MTPIFLGVMLFGALGTGARWMVTSYWPFSPQALPYGVLTVNILGSFFIGLLYSSKIVSVRFGLGWEQILLVGFLGGFTTFSSFSLDSVRLFQEGSHYLAIANVILNNFCGIAGCFLGIWAAAHVNLHL